MIESDDYKKGWYDGYQAARKERDNQYIPTTPYIAPKVVTYDGCTVCGRTGVSNVVCYLQNCPSRVVSYKQSDYIPINK